jgi:hypothetical protein
MSTYLCRDDADEAYEALQDDAIDALVASRLLTTRRPIR